MKERRFVHNIGTTDTGGGDRLQEFYENRYVRSSETAKILEDDDFMYGQVLRVLSPFLTSGMRVLDLGCNTGCLSLYMARRCSHVTGIDLARSAVETAKRSGDHYGIRNVEFHALDFLQEWRAPAMFDLVLCCHVLEHIPNDEALLEKVHFATKADGRILLFVPTLYSSLYRTHKFFKGGLPFDQEVGHLRRYDRKMLTALLERTGYKVENIVFLDSVLREWIVLFRPLRWTMRVVSRRYIRSVVNTVDRILAHFLFPATLCTCARRS